MKLKMDPILFNLSDNLPSYYKTRGADQEVARQEDQPNVEEATNAEEVALPWDLQWKQMEQVPRKMIALIS
jgi:hypothetical protein